MSDESYNKFIKHQQVFIKLKTREYIYNEKELNN